MIFGFRYYRNAKRANESAVFRVQKKIIVILKTVSEINTKM